ncbi:MAG: MoaD/ThiS family protein [Chloroflexi bacterium]|nr:MoaD/ThiS family protein [Chloroflexota bacterium]
MHVNVKLFANLLTHVADAKVGVPFPVDLPDGATVGDLIRLLKLPADQIKVTFVNGRSRSDDWRLESGDEIGIFPPIGGG